MADSGRVALPTSPLNRGEVFYYLKSRKPADREELLRRVAGLRVSSGLDRVHAFGLVTLSSFCVRDCVYCGFRSDSPLENIYRLARSEIMAAARAAAEAGLRRLVLRSGCDPSLTPESITEVIRDLRQEFDFELGLSLGERGPEEFAAWRGAGAAWYWLFRDTGDPSLYRRVRPSMSWSDRARSFEALLKSGLQVGSGMMLGLPNQSHESLVEDLLDCAAPGIHAVCLEPFLPPADSPGYRLLARPENLILSPELPVMEKATALLRMLRPDLLITVGASHDHAYDTVAGGALFTAGANAVIFDFTPREYLFLGVSAPFLGIPADEGRAVREAGERLAARGFRLALRD